MTSASKLSLLENLFLMEPMHHQLPDLVQSIEQIEHFRTAGLEEALRRQAEWVKTLVQFYRMIDPSCFAQSLDELKKFCIREIHRIVEIRTAKLLGVVLLALDDNSIGNSIGISNIVDFTRAIEAFLIDLCNERLFLKAAVNILSFL